MVQESPTQPAHAGTASPTPIHPPTSGTVSVYKPKPIMAAHAMPGKQVIIKKPMPERPTHAPRHAGGRSAPRRRDQSRNNRGKVDESILTTTSQTTDRPLQTGPLPHDCVKIIPLGGFGEIGKNILVYDYKDDIIVVDCGMMIPDEGLLGIDLVIPDVRYLIENKKRIKGWIFTHGHEDHIGSVPFIIPKQFEEVTMYAGDLTAGMIKFKLQETGMQNPKISVVKPGNTLHLGAFKIEFVRVAHSIPDDMALCIDTDEGRILHVPDWKIDHTPLWNGQVTDIARFSELGREGIDLMLGESTNVTRPGYTPSEQLVAESYEKIFKESQGRIIVAMFSSLINRIQQIFNASVKFHRKVAISGRSMEKNIQIAMELGYLKAPEGLLVDLRRIGSIPDDQITVLSTGAQGEEYSGLVRIASGEHRHIKIRKSDTVIISASPIQGNENAVNETINNLFRQGAMVYSGNEVDVHVSGHAHIEELKLLLSITKPHNFIPQHGEYYMLRRHAQLAIKLGVEPDHTFVIENGQVVLLKDKKVTRSDVKVQAGAILVDGLGIGDVGAIVLRDRQAMAKDGIFVLILTVDRQTGKLVTSPDIISRGFIYMREREDLVNEARSEIKRIFANHNDRYPLQWDLAKRMIRDHVGEFLFEKTQRRPMVIPVVIEV